MRVTLVVKNFAFAGLMASPLMLSIGSAWSALIAPSDTREPATAWVLIALASMAMAINLHTSYLRPALYAKLHDKSMEGYKHASGIPLVGSILAAIAVLVAWGKLSVAAASLVILFADTGSVVWLFAALARDSSFWSETKSA
jgi:cobalamin synthase